MKTKKIFLAVIILSSICSIKAQEKRFGFELNSGASVATKKLGGDELSPGFGFEGILHYRFMPHFGAYTGWGWNRFGVDNSFVGNNASSEETGYVFGLQFKHPFENSNFSYYVRGGALYNHIETENSLGEIANDTKHGFGYQLAGGIDLNVGSNWSLTTGLKFNSLSRETLFNNTPKQMDLRYLSLRVGIIKYF